MRLLLTADWQAQIHNLDLCERFVSQLVPAIHKYKPDAVIHAGDVKEQYDPLPTLVIKWCLSGLSRLVETGVPVYVMLGNHDRISQSRESKNWLDILKRSGVQTISTPRSFRVGDGNVSFLPYTPNQKEERRWAKKLYKGSDEPSVLIFHTEVKDAVFNTSGIVSGGSSLESLQTDKYDACFGGHLHIHQKVGDNTWYIGSPFCHDWNEANVPHGFLGVDIEEGKAKVVQIPSKIPNWYDIDYLKTQNGFRPEKGAYIRSKITVTSKKVIDQIQEEERRIQKKYPDVRVFVVPKVEQSQDSEVELTGQTDKEKIAQYVGSTIPDSGRFSVERVVSYLTRCLKTSPSVSIGREITFCKMSGRNILSFEEVEADLENLGLVLIRGINRHWPKRSNGAGKTALLSLVPLIAFGKTLKEQKHDDWIREGSEGGAHGTLTCKDERGRIIEIIRSRPHGVILKIDGEDKSSGIRGIGKDETQGLIEEAIGFDLQTLLNSVYIDQTITNGFVFGTQKGRMDLVGKLLDLHRFDTALEVVKDDIKKSERLITEAQNRVDTLASNLERLKSDVQELKGKTEVLWSQKRDEAHTEVKRLVQEHSAIMGVEETYKQKQTDLDDMFTDRDLLDKSIADVRGKLIFWRKQKQLGRMLAEAGKCDRCGQPTLKAGRETELRADRHLPKLEKLEAQLAKSREGKELRVTRIESALETFRERVDQVENQLEAARAILVETEEAAQQEYTRNQERELKLQFLLTDYHYAKRYLNAAKTTIRDYSIDREMLEYAKKSFSRSGIPIYLSASLCPLLNKAAEDYSEIFTNGELKLRFYVESDEFKVDVINPAGSETSKGQSTGESAMAGPIAAFAIREAAPKTNLLILDEPGSGLDSEGARQFSQGLLKLKAKFSTILVTSHSPVIEGILSGETVWTVTKQNRISRLKK